MSNISMVFAGYRREINEGGLPNYGGVYTVYRCTHNRANDTVTLHEVLYIGQAQDINSRISNHEKKPRWKAKLQYGEELCFGYAQISVNDGRDRAEAALIYKHKPQINSDFKDSFPFETTTMSLSGATAKLVDNYTVYKTGSAASALYQSTLYQR